MNCWETKESPDESYVANGRFVGVVVALPPRDPGAAVQLPHQPVKPRTALMLGSHVGELAALATALLWTLSALAWTSAGKRIGSLAVSFIRLPIAAAMMMVYGQIVRGRCLPTACR